MIWACPLRLLLCNRASPLSIVYCEHIEAERLYLASRKKEPESDVIACECVALLIKYETAG